MTLCSNRCLQLSVTFALLATIVAAFPVRLSGAEPDGKPTVLPAVLKSVSPTGAMRGGSTVITLTGDRLSGATGVYFDDPAINARILSVDPAPPTKPAAPSTDPKPVAAPPDAARVEISVGADARIGIHKLLIQTPRGTTGSVPFAVSGCPEVKEQEPNDGMAPTQTLSLPTTLLGSLERSGDSDAFRFAARAGQDLVFELVAASIRSKLNGILTITDEQGHRLAEANSTGSRPEPILGHRFGRSGNYVIRVRDFENASGEDVYYRLNVGEFSYVTSVYPLGLRKGSSREFALSGFNLPSRAISVTDSSKTTAWAHTIPLPGTFLTAPRLAVGEAPEIEEAEPNSDPAHAQHVMVPVTVNGRIDSPRLGEASPTRRPRAVDLDQFRFRARRGQRLIIEVHARRLGSQLDSCLEIVDQKGQVVDRATLRPVAETSLIFSHRDSNSGSFRIQSWTDLAVNDFIFVGRELLQIKRLPATPDEECSFYSLKGSRLGLLDTTPEAHSIGTVIYKVTVHPAGRQFPPNGMPVFRLGYRNDDGGPQYGKDSRLTFDPPTDGWYTVRLKDARGSEGPRHGYRLSIRPPRPDYKLSLSPEHPNVQAGSSVPITVGIERFDGFNHPVSVRLEGLPPGFSCTEGVIAPNAESTLLTLTAAPEAVTPAVALTSSTLVVGRAMLGGQEMVRSSEPENGRRLITVLPAPDVRVVTDLRTVTLKPGGTVEVSATVERRNGFKGRVPIDVRNLPFGVQVRDLGLNGVLITEQQTSRRFVIIAESWVQPQKRPFYAVARVESDPATEVASEPVLLTVEPPHPQAGTRQASR